MPDRQRFVVRESRTKARGYRVIVRDSAVGGREMVVFSSALGPLPQEARALADEAAAYYEALWRTEGEAGAARAYADAGRRRAAQERELAFRWQIAAARREGEAIRHLVGQQRTQLLPGLDGWAMDREMLLREERDRFRATLTGDEGIRW